MRGTASATSSTASRSTRRPSFSRCTSTVRSWTRRRGRGGPSIARTLSQPKSATETAAA
jgi:hypothetical protein